MLFNSIDFLIFFPVVVSVYFVVPKKVRYIWLLVSSYYFYMSWNPKYALLIALSTIITYATSLLYSRSEKIKVKRFILVFSLISNLGILVVFKYSNFIISNINLVLTKFGITTTFRSIDLLLPVGISFYTFQALSYTIDVYKGVIKPEKNILRYALYVSFFPQLVAGPIERSKNLLPQVQNIEKIKLWNYERIKHGFLLMVWGFFQKLVVADRASILVKNVFQNYENFGFLEIAVAAACFAFQIYGDFGGYTNIARGAALIMGFDLMDNFRQPYLATSIKEFWRRWHISLTSWFTDYLYIPLGGNRKGTARKYLNILIVFGVSGLWHGASWNFVAWGLLHAFYQVAENLISDLKIKFLPDFCPYPASLSSKIRHTVFTFILVDIAWIFFAADSLKHALSIIKQMFTYISRNPSSIGLEGHNIIILLFAVSVVFIVDLIHEKNISLVSFINRQECWFRWISCTLLIWSVIMLGIYGEEYDTSSFIYFQF